VGLVQGMKEQSVGGCDWERVRWDGEFVESMKVAYPRACSGSRCAERSILVVMNQ
jgi:hypothetical protein